ncbi:MAG: phage/plasmid primase, P4 family [Candidatus Poribacteria bacterium]|nr:phage/plasmid primase, P4 family [Candidatus Poribacteria bacterium]
MANNILTIEEVKAAVKEYAVDPSSEKLQDVLTCAAPLSPVERAEIVNDLARYVAFHGMNKTELKAELSRLLNTTDEADFYDGNVLKPLRVVNALMGENHYLHTVEDGQLRIYRDGVFAADKTRQTAREIISLLDDDVMSTNVSNVLSLLQDMTTALSPIHTDYVNLANGRWCLNAWELLSHQPIYRSTVQLPVKYDPEAKCPEFSKWLANVLPNPDDRFLLLQLFGYSMLQDVRFGKIAVLYGPTHTGKSTCLDVLKAFLGVDNVSALTLHALDNEERRFSRAGLVGKLANLSADLSSKYLAGDSQIKQITVGDPMQVEFKGVQSFTYSPFATLWASSNQLPVSHDRTDAWYERLVIIPFMEQHKGKAADRKLLERLTQPSELSGILNLVLDALQVLLNENAFKETDSTRKMLEMYKEQNDHVARFLSEEYQLVKDQYVLEYDVYNHYKDWCENGEGIKPLSKTKFRDGVRMWGASRVRKGSSDRFFVFEGMQNL